MTELKKHRKSVVAFLDILGFKDLIRARKDLEGNLLDILYGLRKENNSFKEDVKENEPYGHRTINYKPNILSFSDHIILSIPLDAYATIMPFNQELFRVGHVLNILNFYISKLQIQTLIHGIALRGAISIGDIVFDANNNLVIGQALIEAIDNEQVTAIYPRVIASESLIQESMRLHKDFSPHKSYYIKDFDGTYFIDFLDLQIRLSSASKDIKILKTIQKRISEKLQEFEGITRVYQKWYWLAKYFDSTIEKCRKDYPFLKNVPLVL